jgi:hypothetical protein
MGESSKGRGSEEKDFTVTCWSATAVLTKNICLVAHYLGHAENNSDFLEHCAIAVMTPLQDTNCSRVFKNY